MSEHFFIENKNELSLAELKLNARGVIGGFKNGIDLKIKRRLLELGFYEGVEISLCGTSFLGDVMLIEINGYTLSLRKNIAQYIIIYI